MKDWELSTQNSIGIVDISFFYFFSLRTARFNRAFLLKIICILSLSFSIYIYIRIYIFLSLSFTIFLFVCLSYLISRLDTEYTGNVRWWWCWFLTQLCKNSFQCNGNVIITVKGGTNCRRARARAR